jgi:hypothetical protein
MGNLSDFNAAGTDPGRERAERSAFSEFFAGPAEAIEGK